MIELTAAEKLAALIDGLDLQARAMFMAGFAGQPVPRSNPSGFIKDLAREREWDLSPKWASPTNSGLYTYLKNFVNGMKAPADDLLQEEFTKGLKSIYYAAGEEASTSDNWAEGIKNGEKSPFDLKGILTKFAKRKAINYKSKTKTRSQIEEEGAYDIGDLTTPASGGGNRSMITDAILSGISPNASDEFLGWLKGLTKEMSPGAGKLMSAYLDLILRGEADSDIEALEKLNASGEFSLPNVSYLGKVKKDFADTASELLSGATKTRNPQLQRMRDMLSDASFLDELSKGHVPGTRAAKLLNGQPRLLSANDYMAELEKASKFEKGVSVSLDELPEELQENVENPPEGVLDLRDEMEGKAAMFEEGKPADPTKNMSAEDAAEWKRQNEKNRDQFKAAGMGHVAGNGYIEDSILKANESLSLASGGMYYRIYGDGVLFARQTPEYKIVSDAYNKIEEITKDLAKIYRSLKNVDLQFTGRAASDKTAAAGLYGFTKSAEKSCTGATGKLAKYAAKLAKELYTKDADAAPFLEEHAKRGFKTAKMLRNAMADVGPGPAPKTASSKSGNGLYGFKDSTAKLAMNACSELHQAAGHLAADLAMKFGEKQEDGAGFLKKHAKAAKCAFSDLILDSYPTAPVKMSTPKKANLDPSVDEILAWDRAVGNRMATSFMASSEDDEELEVESDVEADDLISSWGKTAFDTVRTAGTYQEYVERKKKKGEKPLSQDKWESRVEGQLAKGRAHPRDQKKEAPTAEGKVTRPAPGKKWPKYEGERTWEKNYRAPAQHVMGAYGLKDDDAEELTKYSRDKPHDTFQKVSPQKLMLEFLRNAKPETRERMKGMSPKDFMIMLRSMTADEPVVEA